MKKKYLVKLENDVWFIKMLERAEKREENIIKKYIERIIGDSANKIYLLTKRFINNI